MHRHFPVSILGVAGLVIWLFSWSVTWWLLMALHSRLAPFVSNPLQVGFAVHYALGSQSTWVHIASTLTFTLVGLAFAALIGIPVGLLIGRYRTVEGILRPLVDTFRALPSAAVIPVAMILLRSDGWQKSIFVVTFGATWPILVNTWDAVTSLPREFIDTLKLLPISEGKALELTLRRALSGVLSGVKVSASVSLILTTTIEMFAPGNWEWGVGQMINTAQTNSDYNGIYAAIVILMLLGYAINTGAHFLTTLSGASLGSSAQDPEVVVREDLQLYLPDALRGLPETTLRVLTGDQVTETLHEIYQHDSLSFRVVSSALVGDMLERTIEFTVGDPPRTILIGRASINVPAMKAELAAIGQSWERASSLLERGSLGIVLRDSLGSSAIYDDKALDVIEQASLLDDQLKTAIPSSRIVRRHRTVSGRNAARLLVSLEEFVAIDTLAISTEAAQKHRSC